MPTHARQGQHGPSRDRQRHAMSAGQSCQCVPVPVGTKHACMLPANMPARWAEEVVALAREVGGGAHDPGLTSDDCVHPRPRSPHRSHPLQARHAARPLRTPTTSPPLALSLPPPTTPAIALPRPPDDSSRRHPAARALGARCRTHAESNLLKAQPALASPRPEYPTPQDSPSRPSLVSSEPASLCALSSTLVAGSR